MTPVHWIAVWIVGLIVAIGGVLYALRDKHRFILDEEDLLKWEREHGIDSSDAPRHANGVRKGVPWAYIKEKRYPYLIPKDPYNEQDCRDYLNERED